MMKPEPVTLFLSYAREDESLRSELETHFSLLQRQGLVSTWHDRQITAGTDWAQEIDEHLKSASMILLLVSANFLASDSYFGMEMQRAFDRDKTGQARLIPIMVRPGNWNGAPFAHLHVLPTDTKAITIWNKQDEAWTDVVIGMRPVIEKLAAHSVFDLSEIGDAFTARLRAAEQTSSNTEPISTSLRKESIRCPSSQLLSCWKFQQMWPNKTFGIWRTSPGK